MRPGDTDSRVRDLEFELNRISRLLESSGLPGLKNTQRKGRFKAKLTAELTATVDEPDFGTASATANIRYHNGTKLIDSGVSVVVYDYFLISGQSIPSGTNIWIEFGEDSKWWVTQASCTGAAESSPVTVNVTLTGPITGSASGTG